MLSVSLSLTLHSLHPNQDETRSSHLRLLLPSSSSPFYAIAITNPGANLRSCLSTDCSRREGEDPGNSQRRKNHGFLLPRRTTPRSWFLRAEIIGYHYHCRSARRRSRKDPLGTQTRRIAGHALCQHSGQRLVSSNR